MIVIQAGAILAVVLIYRARLRSLAAGIASRDPIGRRVAVGIAKARRRHRNDRRRNVRARRHRVRVASILASVLVLGACGGGSRSSEPVQLESTAHPIGAAAWGVASGDELWVSNPAAGVVVAVDDSGAVVRKVATAAPDPRDAGMAIVGDQLWVANLGGTVGVLDTVTGAPIGRIDVGPGEPAAVAVGDGYAWVPLHGPGGGLAKIDAQRLEVIARVDLPESAFDVAVAGRSVWVAGLDRRVFEIDATTAEVRRTIDVGAAPRGITTTDDAVWVTLRDDQEVVRIDAQDGTITDRVELDGQPWPIATGDGAVWVADLDGTVTRIDADTNKITGKASADPQPRAIAIRRGAVWIASQTGQLTRVAFDTTSG